MIRLPNRPQLILADHYNATTSLINCGAHPSQHPLAQSVAAVVYPLGSGELTANMIFTLTGSADSNGPRFRLGHTASGAGAMIFNGHSSGAAGQPDRAAANSSTPYNEWSFVSGTWDGGLIGGDSIRMYSAIANADVEEITYVGPGLDGTGTALTGAGNSLVLGNRGDAGRTYNGSIAYITRWARVLSLQELQQVRRNGPLSVPSGLIFCWANGRDYGPYGVRAVVRTAMAFRTWPRTALFPLGPLADRRVYLDAPAAPGGFFSRYYYDMIAGAHV